MYQRKNNKLKKWKKLKILKIVAWVILLLRLVPEYQHEPNPTGEEKQLYLLF
jgi:hypothetical protein